MSPYAVVFLLKSKVLQARAIEMAYVFSRQNFLCFLNVLLALINKVNLTNERLTVTKSGHKNSLAMRPMPAPQSRTVPSLNLGKTLINPDMNFRLKATSRSFRLAKPPMTPL